MGQRIAARRSAAFLAVALCAAIPAAADPAATITVDANRTQGAVNRFVFGHNIEGADGFGIFGDKHHYIHTRTGDGVWHPEKHEPMPAPLADAKAIGMGMLRYPGGCLAHNFDWKLAVGPLSERPNYTFGLNEYLTYCRMVGAEPLITVSDYKATPQDAADLVEYLNAPATAKYPWAQKRAADGHPAPYGVRWFEMGNESDHGNHKIVPFRKFTPEEYAAWYNESARKMRAIDPSIKMGALMGTGTGPFDPWNAKVLAGTKNDLDFVIVHTYAVGLSSPTGVPVAISGDVLMRACLASPDQMEHMLGQYREEVRKHTGRDIPLAITEYNASFVQDKPLPYRYSYGAALFSADYVRVMLKPETNVNMAHYWHYINGYWGMVRGPIPPADGEYSKMPAYYLFRLWGEHFKGDDLVKTSAETPRVEFAGFRRSSGKMSVAPMTGDRYLPAGPIDGKNLLQGLEPIPGEGKNWKFEKRADGALAVTLTNQAEAAYPNLLAAPVAIKPGGSYRLSFEARIVGAKGRAKNIGINAIDARGWDRTKSGVPVAGVEHSDGNWQRFEGVYYALPDTTGVQLAWRLIPDAEPISGTVEVRGLSLVQVRPETLPAYAAITTAASRSKDGKTLYVVVFNKDPEKDIETTIQLPGFKAASVRRWTVNGPSLDTVNQGSNQVREVETNVVTPLAADGSVRHTFPAHSMTAFEIQRQ